MTCIFFKFRERNENQTTFPFDFCTYSYRYTYTCVRCGNQSSSPNHPGSLIIIPVPRGLDYTSSQFDMNAAVIRTLEASECDRHCDECENEYGYEKLVSTDTRQFLMLQLVLFQGPG